MDTVLIQQLEIQHREGCYQWYLSTLKEVATERQWQERFELYVPNIHDEKILLEMGMVSLRNKYTTSSES